MLIRPIQGDSHEFHTRVSNETHVFRMWLFSHVKNECSHCVTRVEENVFNMCLLLYGTTIDLFMLNKWHKYYKLSTCESLYVKSQHVKFVMRNFTWEVSHMKFDIRIFVYWIFSSLVMWQKFWNCVLICGIARDNLQVVHYVLFECASFIAYH